MTRDMNIVFPVERLREFEKEGIIGRLADIHYGFMGHIVGTHIDTLITVTAPDVAERLKTDDVDIVLLTPGWGICNQTVGLIQREIEKTGIPTIGISIVREYTEKVKPPRTVYLRWPFGHPLGEPFNSAQQRAVLSEAFKELFSIQRPGEIIDLPFKWRREKYNNYNLEELRKL
jgi:D-proline reductase (dithiol) PrdB